MRLAASILLLAVAASGARAAAPDCPFEGQTSKLVVQMFFGQSIGGQSIGGQSIGGQSIGGQSIGSQSMRGQGLISRRAWQRFVADTITPALPQGFTVYDAYGQWQDPMTQAIGREPTEVVLVAAANTPAFRARIAAIAEAYRRRFAQRSIGIVSSTECGVF